MEVFHIDSWDQNVQLKRIKYLIWTVALSRELASLKEFMGTIYRLNGGIYSIGVSSSGTMPLGLFTNVLVFWINPLGCQNEKKIIDTSCSGWLLFLFMLGFSFHGCSFLLWSFQIGHNVFSTVCNIILPLILLHICSQVRRIFLLLSDFSVKPFLLKCVPSILTRKLPVKIVKGKLQNFVSRVTRKSVHREHFIEINDQIFQQRLRRIWITTLPRNIQ